MEKIFIWLASFEKDKVLHFALSVVIGLFVACVAKLAGGSVCNVALATFLIGMFVGVAKEIRDDVFDWYDLLADFIGVLVSTLAAVVLLL